MQTKIIVLGKISDRIENFLHERGIFDALSCFDFEDCIKLFEKFEDTQSMIVFCRNDEVDALVERLKTVNDKFSLVNEQAVKMERVTTFKTTYFVPIESDFEDILNDILPLNESFVYAIFGKSENFLRSKLDELKCDVQFKYHIFKKSDFLHMVYTSKKVDESIFEGGIYSNKRESLSQALETFLKSKTISVVDNMTGGLLSSEIWSAAKNNLVSSEIICNEKQFEKVGLDELFLEANGAVDKATAFEMAKNLLKNFKTDLAIAITGFDCDAGRTFVAVGNKDEIYVYSSIFYGDKEEIVKNACDFAIFKAICFLKEKYQ